MIYGHETIRETLKKGLEDGTLPQAMIFAGPEGIGKGLVADELWKHEFEGEVLGDAVNILRVEPRDYGMSRIEVKDLEEYEIHYWASLAAPKGLNKWCIVEKAHCLEDKAAQTLLKITEEPNIRFIFLTDRPELIPSTLHSRMALVEFNPLEPEQVAKIGEALGMKDPRWIEFNRGAVVYPDQASFEEALVQFETWCSLLNGTGTLSKEGSCLIPVKEAKGLALSEQLRKPIKMLQRILEDSAGKKLGLPLGFSSFKDKIPAFQDEVSRRTNEVLSKIHLNLNSHLLLYYILQGKR